MTQYKEKTKTHKLEINVNEALTALAFDEESYVRLPCSGNEQIERLREIQEQRFTCAHKKR